MVQHQAEHIEQSKLLQRIVMDIVHKQGKGKVKDIVNSLQILDKSVTFNEIRDAINELKHDKMIELREPRVIGSFFSYIMSLFRAAPFWLTVTVTMLTLATIYLTPQVAPWSTIRVIAGAGFVLFIPGYALLQILFPAKHMDSIERTALSVGLSLAVAPLIGLILNFSPWGIRLDPIVVSLSIASITLVLAGTYKEFMLRKHSP